MKVMQFSHECQKKASFSESCISVCTKAGIKFSSQLELKLWNLWFDFKYIFEKNESVKRLY